MRGCLRTGRWRASSRASAAQSPLTRGRNWLPTSSIHQSTLELGLLRVLGETPLRTSSSIYEPRVQVMRVPVDGMLHLAPVQLGALPAIPGIDFRKKMAPNPTRNMSTLEAGDSSAYCGGSAACRNHDLLVAPHNLFILRERGRERAPVDGVFHLAPVQLGALSRLELCVLKRQNLL